MLSNILFFVLFIVAKLSDTNSEYISILINEIDAEAFDGDYLEAATEHDVSSANLSNPYPPPKVDISIYGNFVIL